MKKIVLLSFSLSIILSCNNSKNKELELKEKELELREKEINLELSKLQKIDTLSQAKVQEIKTQGLVNTESTGQKQNETVNVVDPSVSNINNLLGYWVDHDNEKIIMYFQRDGTFIFNDLNYSTESYEELTGTYKLRNGKLTLLYDDRASQNFNFVKEISKIPTYYIQKGRYLMVKAIIKE